MKAILPPACRHTPASLSDAPPGGASRPLSRRRFVQGLGLGGLALAMGWP